MTELKRVVIDNGRTKALYHTDGIQSDDLLSLYVKVQRVAGIQTESLCVFIVNAQSVVIESIGITATHRIEYYYPDERINPSHDS